MDIYLTAMGDTKGIEPIQKCIIIDSGKLSVCLEAIRSVHNQLVKYSLSDHLGLLQAGYCRE